MSPRKLAGGALVIGLTGGIASGKSTVGDQFIALGVPLLDGDHVAREVVAPPSPALAAIAAHFGAEYLQPDGALDRRRLRERVFSDPASRRELEAITHPLIRRRILEWRDAQRAPYCILSVAILVESGMHQLVDRILAVDVPQATQLERLVLRDGIAEPLAQQMIAAQASRSERLARADDVVDNTYPPQSLAPQVKRLHRLYLEIAGTSP
ncbi:dephospho-CoA kinase [Nevskia soli]|uniref:dephospho-CoA kinase n=1 Tax=Nevskia soli TaxID=418856 RepID=UPI0004A6C747|nr:dephospho-CoA kinase [Nevskia soli]